jgi:hypothetical protein
MAPILPLSCERGQGTGETAALGEGWGEGIGIETESRNADAHLPSSMAPILDRRLLEAISRISSTAKACGVFATRPWWAGTCHVLDLCGDGTWPACRVTRLEKARTSIVAPSAERVTNGIGCGSALAYRHRVGDNHGRSP